MIELKSINSRMVWNKWDTAYRLTLAMILVLLAVSPLIAAKITPPFGEGDELVYDILYTGSKKPIHVVVRILVAEETIGGYRAIVDMQGNATREAFGILAFRFDELTDIFDLALGQKTIISVVPPEGVACPVYNPDYLDDYKEIIDEAVYGASTIRVTCTYSKGVLTSATVESYLPGEEEPAWILRVQLLESTIPLATSPPPGDLLAGTVVKTSIALAAMAVSVGGYYLYKSLRGRHGEARTTATARIPWGWPCTAGRLRSTRDHRLHS